MNLIKYSKMSQQQQPTTSNASMDTSLTVDDSKDRFARENHSEIERRRRNKMTHYINGIF